MLAVLKDNVLLTIVQNAGAQLNVADLEAPLNIANRSMVKLNTQHFVACHLFGLGVQSAAVDVRVVSINIFLLQSLQTRFPT